MVVEIVESPRDTISITLGGLGYGQLLTEVDPLTHGAHVHVGDLASDFLVPAGPDTERAPVWIAVGLTGASLRIRQHGGRLATCVALQDRPALCFPLDTSGALGHDTHQMRATTTAHDRTTRPAMRHQRQGL
jgi:hypothetical protein